MRKKPNEVYLEGQPCILGKTWRDSICTPGNCIFWTYLSDWEGCTFDLAGKQVSEVLQEVDPGVARGVARVVDALVKKESISKPTVELIKMILQGKSGQLKKRFPTK